MRNWFARKKARGTPANVPDDAKCQKCLGYGTVFHLQNAGIGQRLQRTVKCPDCNGYGIRVIPLRDLK